MVGGRMRWRWKHHLLTGGDPWSRAWPTFKLCKVIAGGGGGKTLPTRAHPLSHSRKKCVLGDCVPTGRRKSLSPFSLCPQPKAGWRQSIQHNNLESTGARCTDFEFDFVLRAIGTKAVWPTGKKRLGRTKNMPILGVGRSWHSSNTWIQVELGTINQMAQGRNNKVFFIYFATLFWTVMHWQTSLPWRWVYSQQGPRHD